MGLYHRPLFWAKFNLPSGKHTKNYWKHGHRNSWFTCWTWWFSIVMLVYQRVWRWDLPILRASSPRARSLLCMAKPPLVHHVLNGHGHRESSWPKKIGKFAQKWRSQVDLDLSTYQIIQYNIQYKYHSFSASSKRCKIEFFLFSHIFSKSYSCFFRERANVHDFDLLKSSHSQPLAHAATCSNLQPLAATCSHLQPLAQTAILQVAAGGCKWLPGQVAASGCKWLPGQVAASGCKRLQPAAAICSNW